MVNELQTSVSIRGVIALQSFTGAGANAAGG